MGVDIERASEPADDADEDEHVDFEDVEGEGDAEAGGEDGDERVDLAQPHRDQPEEDGADHRGEEPAPVVPHREEHGCYLGQTRGHHEHYIVQGDSMTVKTLQLT